MPVPVGHQQHLSADWRNISPGPTLSTHSSYTPTNNTSVGATPPRTAKGGDPRYGAPGTMHLATQTEEGPYFPQPQQQQPPPIAGSSTRQSVVVHQDAGRVPTKADEAAEDRVDEPPEEIPPTYDSIGR